MNLNVLSINVMLLQSRHWLSDPAIRAQLLLLPLGAGLLLHLEQAHDRLASQSERRRLRGLSLAELTARMTVLGRRHDSKARALYATLQGLIDGTDDPARAGAYRSLQEMLFPEKLLIVNRSYAYRAGAVEAMSHRVTADIIAQMERTPVGDETLADWYRAWVDAGHELGKLVAERLLLVNRTTRGGSRAADVNLRMARMQWINTVRTFLSAIDIMDIDRTLRENLLSPLIAAVTAAVRARNGNVDDFGDPDDSDSTDSDGGDSIGDGGDAIESVADGIGIGGDGDDPGDDAPMSIQSGVR